MASSGMLGRVALVRTDVSEELSASVIRVTRIGELGTTLAVTSNRRTLRRNTKSVLTRATRRNIPEDSILRSHRRENFKSYITGFLIASSKIESTDCPLLRVVVVRCQSNVVTFRISINPFALLPSNVRFHSLHGCLCIAVERRHNIILI
jgi:hypothetical protein